MSYVAGQLFRRRPVRNLEDFFISRFGRELPQTFFKSYTEKVWGVPCDQIKPEWGAQRVKGLSITRAVLHALKSTFSKDPSVTQQGTETSLIDKFMYPKLGPGQMWEEVARRVVEKGGAVHLRCRLVLGRQHLIHLVNSYTRYYHQDRRHLGLERDTPEGSTVKPIEHRTIS